MRLAHERRQQHSRALYPPYGRNAGSSQASRIKDLRLSSVPPSKSTLSNRSFIFVASDSDSESDDRPSAPSHPPSLPCIVPLSPISPILFSSAESPIASPLVPTSPTCYSDGEFDSDDELESDYDDDGDDDFASSCSSETGVGTDGDEEEDFKVAFGFGVKRHDEDIGFCVGKEYGKGGCSIRRQKPLPHSHRYRYQLVSALPMARFTTGPSSMNAPWPYTFQKGAIALARTAQGIDDPHTGLWRRVTIIDNGHLSSFPLPSTPLPSAPLLSFSRLPVSFPQIASRSVPDLNSRAHLTPDFPSRLNASLLSPEYSTMTVPQPASPSSSSLSPSPSPSPALMYTAEWFDAASGRTFKGTFCPTRGDLKPDDGHARRLLAKEGCRLIE